MVNMKTKEDYKEIYMDARKRLYETDCLELKRTYCNQMNLALFCITNLMNGNFAEAKKYLGIE